MKKVLLNIVALIITCAFAISIPAALAEASGYSAAENTVMSVSKVATKKPTIKKKDGKYYYYNKDGKQVTRSGWKKLSNTSYVYVGKQGYVTYRLYKKNGKMNYTKWNKKRFVKVRYKNKIYKINGKYYYFDKKGNISSSVGWKQINKTNAVYVGKQGYVTYRLYRSNGKVNYTKWNTAKKRFVKVTSYKNTIKKINGSNYYFDGGGNILSRSGWYGTYNFDRYGRDDFVYIDKNGCVAYKFYKKGEKYYYLKWNGKKFTKVTDCKNTVLVMEDDIKFYIDENGNISDTPPEEQDKTEEPNPVTPECTHENKQDITINWYYPEIRDPKFQPIYVFPGCGCVFDTPEEADEHLGVDGHGGNYMTGYYDYDRIIGWTVKAAAHVEKDDSGYGGWKCPDCGKVEYTKLFIETLIDIKNDEYKLEGKYYCYDKDGNPISGTRYNDVAWVRTNYHMIWNDEYQSILDAGLKQYPELKDYKPTY